MLCMRRLEIRFSDEVASAAVLDHVAKSVACIGITARAPAQSIRDRICAKQLATATIQYLRLVGDTAWQRRRRVSVNNPSYSQPEAF